MQKINSPQIIIGNRRSDYHQLAPGHLTVVRDLHAGGARMIAKLDRAAE